MRILEKEAQEAKAKAREQVCPAFFFLSLSFPLLSEAKASASKLGPHALASGRIH
jgi:hypothetical protein